MALRPLPVIPVPFHKSLPWLESLAARNSWHLKMGPIDCSETSITTSQSTLPNISDERRSHQRFIVLPLHTKHVTWAASYLERGWGRSKHNCLVSYFIMMTTCFGHCGPSSGHKNYSPASCTICKTSYYLITHTHTHIYIYIYIYPSNSYTLPRRGTFSSVCVIQPTTISRWKFGICTYSMIKLCIVFIYIHFCDLKMAHIARNMSSSA